MALLGLRLQVRRLRFSPLRCFSSSSSALRLRFSVGRQRTNQIKQQNKQTNKQINESNQKAQYKTASEVVVFKPSLSLKNSVKLGKNCFH